MELQRRAGIAGEDAGVGDGEGQGGDVIGVCGEHDCHVDSGAGSDDMGVSDVLAAGAGGVQDRVTRRLFVRTS